MKKGDIVMIYEDPFTCKKEEGEAKLIKRHIGGLQQGVREYWEVRFKDHTQVNRWIKPN